MNNPLQYWEVVLLTWCKGYKNILRHLLDLDMNHVVDWSSNIQSVIDRQLQLQGSSHSMACGNWAHCVNTSADFNLSPGLYQSTSTKKVKKTVMGSLLEYCNSRALVIWLWYLIPHNEYIYACSDLLSVLTIVLQSIWLTIFHLVPQIHTDRQDVYNNNSQEKNNCEMKLQSDFNCDIILFVKTCQLILNCMHKNGWISYFRHHVQ